jgi:hypothetical protein
VVSEDVAARVTSYIRHQGAKPNDVLAGIVADSQSRLVDTLGSHNDADAARKPAPDEWSLRDLLRHVVAAEAGVAAMVGRLARGEPSDGVRGTGSMIDDDGATYDAMLARLRETNERLLAAIRAIPADAPLDVKSAHPFFGDLNCREWAAFQKIHDEDHIQHAGKIIATWA